MKTFALICAMLVATASAETIYVSNERGGDVSVIDSATNQVVKTIPVGKRPRGIHLSRDGNTLYVALSGSPITPPGQENLKLPVDRKADGIGVVDLTSGKLTKVLPSGVDPEQFSLGSDDARMYISNEDADSLTVLDVARGEHIAVVPVGHEPEGVALTPDGKRVWVTGETSNRVDVIDTSNDSPIAQLKTAERPRSIAFLPDASKAFITCETAGKICVADVASAKVVKTISPPGANVRPMGIVISADGKRAYVTTGRGMSVVVIDTQCDEVVGVVEKVGARPWGIGFSNDGNR